MSIQRLRRARLHHGGNVIELEAYRDAAARIARVEEARQVLNAGGALPVARRRTKTDERSVELLDYERARPSVETLMLGILERTLLDLRGANRLRRAEAEAWLTAEDRSHVFGFGTICDQLGREADEVRAALRGHTADVRGEG